MELWEPYKWPKIGHMFFFYPVFSGVVGHYLKLVLCPLCWKEYLFPVEAKLKSCESGQISIIPKPELRGFWGSSLIKPPFRVTSADVVIICPGE